jgi:hypothetical protein
MGGWMGGWVGFFQVQIAVQGAAGICSCPMTWQVASWDEAAEAGLDMCGTHCSCCD